MDIISYVKKIDSKLSKMNSDDSHKVAEVLRNIYWVMPSEIPISVAKFSQWETPHLGSSMYNPTELQRKEESLYEEIILLNREDAIELIALLCPDLSYLKRSEIFKDTLFIAKLGRGIWSGVNGVKMVTPIEVIYFYRDVIDGAILNTFQVFLLDILDSYLPQNEKFDELLIKIEPGNAPPKVIAEILKDFSMLYRKIGGSGLNITPKGVQTYSPEYEY